MVGVACRMGYSSIHNLLFSNDASKIDGCAWVYVRSRASGRARAYGILMNRHVDHNKLAPTIVVIIQARRRTPATGAHVCAGTRCRQAGRQERVARVSVKLRYCSERDTVRWRRWWRWRCVGVGAGTSGARGVLACAACGACALHTRRVACGVCTGASSD